VVLKVLRPLYGVLEAGNHWFKTYHTYYTNQLGMEQSTYDPCLLYDPCGTGTVGLQTDDTLFTSNKAFAAKEQEELDKAGFTAKAREQLTPTSPLKFNGGLIQLLPDNTISLTQEQQCQNLRTVATGNAANTSTKGAARVLSPKEQYVAQRARGAYIASVCQPEASFDLSFAAQAVNPIPNDVDSLNKRLKWQIDSPNRGLRFV
jgi:hypothetical protein